MTTPVTIMPITIRLASSQTRTFRGGFTFVELVVVITVIAALAAIGFPVYRSVRKASDVSATQSMVQAVATAMSTYQLKTWTWETKAAKPNATPPEPAEMRTYHLWDLNRFASDKTTLNPDIKMGEPEGITPKAKFFSIDGYTPGSKSTHNKNGKNQQQIFNEASDPLKSMMPRDGARWDGNFPTAVIKSGYTGFMNMVAPNIHKSFIRSDGIIIDRWLQPLRIHFQAKIFGTDSFGIWSAGYDKYDQTFRNDSLNDLRWNHIPDNVDDLRSWK